MTLKTTWLLLIVTFGFPAVNWAGETKTDNRQVWIWDMEDFPDRKWVVAEANKSTRNYEMFYKAAPNFKMNLGSVKWDVTP